MTRRITPDCRARLERLFDYIDGVLTPQRARQLEKHLAGCECCARLERELEMVVAASRASSGIRMPAAVRKRARARIKRLLGTKSNDSADVF